MVPKVGGRIRLGLGAVDSPHWNPDETVLGFPVSRGNDAVVAVPNWSRGAAGHPPELAGAFRDMVSRSFLPLKASPLGEVGTTLSLLDEIIAGSTNAEADFVGAAGGSKICKSSISLLLKTTKS
jgi:hypothetical protein